MLRYNHEHLSEDYGFNHEHFKKDIDTKKQVAIITAYTQPAYEFKFNELLFLKDFFHGLLNNTTIKELKFSSALSNRQLKALRSLIEDQKRIVKISLPDKTLPQPDGKIDTDERFISSCLETNAKLAKQVNHQFFDSALVELVIDNPRLFLFVRFCNEIIKHPAATKISIAMPLTHKQFVNLSAILAKNTRITAVFIQGKDVLDHAREQGVGIVGLASHVYSSVKSELNETVVKLVTALMFNSCLGAVQKGENDILQIPLECSKVQTTAIVKCLQNSNNLRRLEMSKFNGQLLSQIHIESKIREIHINTAMQKEDFDALALFLTNNSSVTDIAYRLYSNELISIANVDSRDTRRLRNELMVNRCLYDLQGSSSLNFQSIAISSIKAKIFIHHLEHLNQISSIKFDTVQIADEDLLGFFNILVRNGTTTLQQFSMVKSALSANTFRLLLNFLKQQTRLTVLQLDEVGLTDAEITLLAEWLQSNPAVTVLSINSNKIGNQGINTLCQALETNRRVSTLGLNGNLFDTTAIPAITRLLSQNRFLARLTLESSCMLENHVESFIKEIKKTNFSIISLRISHHTYNNRYTKGGYNGQLIITAYKQKYLEMISKFTSNNSKKCDELFTHVRRGEIAEINKMFDYKVSPLSTDSNGDSALHIALAQDPINIALIKCLLQRGCHPLLMNNNLKAPVDLLTDNSSPELCQLLQSPEYCFSDNPVALEPNSKRVKSTPTPVAPEKKFMERFLTGGQKRPQPQEPAVAMPDIAASPERKVARIIPDNSPAPKTINAQNSAQVAYFAVINKDMRQLRQCLTQMNPVQIYPDGNTLLHLAVMHGAIDCLHILNVYKDAAQTRNLFLQHPLHLACIHIDMLGTTEAVEMTSSGNLEGINSPDAFGQTPLFCLTGGFIAINENAYSDRIRAEAAKMLLEHNADPNVAIDDLNLTRSRVSILQKAIARGLYRLAKVLIASPRCNLSYSDAEAWTVLHYAVYFGRLEILARLLIQPQVNLDAINQQGKTARQMARESQFAAYVLNVPQLKEQIESLFEARSRQRLVSPASGIHWVKNLSIRFGSRHGRNLDIMPSFNEEHAALQNAVRSQLNNPGNHLSASLTFIVSKGAHQPDAHLVRVAVKVDMTFTQKFHATHAWQSKKAIEKPVNTSFFKEIERSPDALARILERFDAAPEDIQNSAVDDVNQESRPLSKAAIEKLFESTDRNAAANFEMHFHHSEGALFDNLQLPDTIEKIIRALKNDSQFTPGCKVYAVVLNAFSKNYLCPDCMVAAMGFQNTQADVFFKNLKSRLQENNCVLPTKSLRAITLFSAQQNYKQSRKTAEDHEDIVIDIRAYPNNKILCQDVTAIQSAATNFMSRKF